MQFKDKTYTAKEFTLGNYPDFSDVTIELANAKDMRERSLAIIKLFGLAFDMDEETAKTLPMRMVREGQKEIAEVNGLNFELAPAKKEKLEPELTDTTSQQGTGDGNS